MDHPILQPLVRTLPEVSIVETTMVEDTTDFGPADREMLKLYLNTSLPCLRFAPVWKEIAKDVKGWSPTVKIGAVNCADQSCDRYQVQHTG